MSKHIYIFLGVSLWTLTTLLVIAPIWPYVYYRLSPQTSETLASNISDTIAEAPVITPSPQTKPDSPLSIVNSQLPRLDLSLPTNNGLIIEKIGVRGQIHEGDNWSEILKKGIWRAPNFGTPEDNQLPIIFAAHRFGYIAWTNSFRTLNSFYNLPKLKAGDTIEVIWNQRKYIYTIYKEEVGTKISDYTANLILYTCELWNSPTRVFKYAKRVS